MTWHALAGEHLAHGLMNELFQPVIRDFKRHDPAGHQLHIGG